MSLAEENKLSTPNYNRASINLNILIKELLKKWWVFLIVGLIAGLLGIYTASLKKITYKSKLTFALDGGDAVSSAISLASQFGFNVGSGKDVFAGDNILEILKSRRMVEQTLLGVDSFENKPYTFIQYYLDQNKDSDSKPLNISFPPGQSRSTFTYAQDSLLYVCYNTFINSYIIAEKPDKKYNIYEVNITNPNEKFTKDFTDKIVSETNSFYISISTEKAKQTLNILEQRVASMKGKVNSSIGNTAKVQDVNLNPAFSEASVPILKEQVDIQAYGGAYSEMFKNLEIARYQYLKQIPLMQIIDAADYPMKKIKVSKLLTAIKFSFIACFLTFLVLWMRNLFKIKTD